MNKLPVGIGLCAVMMACLLTGCATTTEITGEWRNPKVKKAGPYHSVFITAVTAKKEVRSQLEDDFKEALAAYGVSSITSHNALPEEESTKKESLIKAARESDADAALVISILDRQTRTQASTISSFDNDYNNYMGQSWVNYNRLTYTYEVFDLEARLFDGGTEKVVWAIRTESLDPKNIKKEIKHYAEMIAGRLGDVGLLGASKP